MSISFPIELRNKDYFSLTENACGKYVSIINKLQEIVKLAFCAKIPDESIDYWKKKLEEYKNHVSEAKNSVSYAYKDSFNSTFLLDDLLVDVEMVLGKFEQRKLELAKLEELEKNIEESSTDDGIGQEATNSEDISSKLPEFHDKNFEEWVKFSNTFTELVHNNIHMPSSTKLNYLREKVKDKPRALIDYLISGPDSNYKLAWETLEKRYDNRRILFTSKLDCLLDMEIMKSDNYRSVQKIHDTAKECIYLMKKHLNRDIGESADEIFAHIIMRKMDAICRDQYEKYVRKTKSIQKLQDVMELLEQQSEILENLENCKDAEPKQVYVRKRNPFAPRP